MSNALNTPRALERGADNLSLDGVASGILAGDTGVVYGLGPYAGRGVLDNWLGVQIDITGGPTTVLVTIQGSIDGVHFYPVATYNATTGGLYFIANFAMRFVQAVLTSLAGGASPAVTVHITQ